jgi:hypothetical protein
MILYIILTWPFESFLFFIAAIVSILSMYIVSKINNIERLLYPMFGDCVNYNDLKEIEENGLKSESDSE